MGLSSNARLLTITARLTSNEYESQQISNAKMRLATQSQEASAEYINALNTQQLLYTTYDAHGDSTSVQLTAGALYQYSDMKNQYVIVNTAGKALISQNDAYNFQNADNLDEFLAAYGLKKEWKSESLQKNVELLESPEYKAKREAWDNAVQAVKSKTDYPDPSGGAGTVTSDIAWAYEKAKASDDYQQALVVYNDELMKANSGISNESELSKALEDLSKAKQKYTACITYDAWAQTKAAIDDSGNYTQVYLDMEEYNKVLDEFNAEAEDYGPTLEDLYTYDDETKAQWYTNLWYRLNGESSEKSLQGKNSDNYSVLDSKLLNSATWIKDALTQGVISIEVASYTESSNEIPDINTPTIVNLKGISWKTSIYSSLTDLTQKDDDQAIAKAEAEYQRKNEEISAKDEKYQNKIKTLDTEHTALQTEYDSVQSALNKNIERSFKTFNG